MANSVVEVLKKWKEKKNFATRSSNTGIHAGVITIIQKANDKCLLFLACRHYILEIILAAEFDQFFQSSGPQIEIFSQFKEHWKLIDTTQYSRIKAPDNEVKSELTVTECVWLNQMKKNMSDFLRNQLSENIQPQKDYLEPTWLSTLRENDYVIQFSPPGVYHCAR